MRFLVFMYSHSLLCLPVCQLDQQDQEHQGHQELREHQAGQCYHAHPGEEQAKHIMYFSWLEIFVWTNHHFCPKFYTVQIKRYHNKKISHVFVFFLTLTPGAPSLPGGPSDPGLPWRQTEWMTEIWSWYGRIVYIGGIWSVKCSPTSLNVWSLKCLITSDLRLSQMNPV